MRATPSMPWLEQRPNGRFHVAFRLGRQKFKKSLRTTDRRTAEARLLQLEENIRLVEKGRMTLTCCLENARSSPAFDYLPEANVRLMIATQGIF